MGEAVLAVRFREYRRQGPGLATLAANGTKRSFRSSEIPLGNVAKVVEDNIAQSIILLVL